MRDLLIEHVFVDVGVRVDVNQPDLAAAALHIRYLVALPRFYCNH